MKTRIIQTRFWDDDDVQAVSSNARFLWIFLLTNKELGMTNYVRIPDDFIKHYLGFNNSQLSGAKDELSKTGKFIFRQNWIFIKNLERENKYKNSPKLEQPYQEELSHIPSCVIEATKGNNTTNDSTIDSSSDSLINSKTINHKSKTINQKEKNSYKKFIENFNRIVGSSHRGDSKTKGMFENRLNDGYSMADFCKAIENASKNEYLMGDNDSGKRYLTPEYILRSNKLDEWLNNSTKQTEKPKKKWVKWTTREVTK